MISPSHIRANTASQLLSQALSPLSPNTRRNTHTSNRFCSCLRFFKALLPAAEMLPHSPQVWWVNLVPPRPTFHLQKGSETAVPREGGPGGQGNLWEEGGEMEWALCFTALRSQIKGFGCWLWVYRVVNRVPDYRTASRCYSPHRYCQNTLDVSRKTNISKFCSKRGVAVQTEDAEMSSSCDQEYLIILNDNSGANRVSTLRHLPSEFLSIHRKNRGSHSKVL